MPSTKLRCTLSSLFDIVSSVCFLFLFFLLFFCRLCLLHAATSNRFRSSRSFCSTSSSRRSTLYCSASFFWCTARARSFASPDSGFLLLLLPPPPLSPFPFLELAGSEEFSSRPCCSSDRAFSASMCRSTRATCVEARSRRRLMAGLISSRREASAAARVGCGISS